MKRVVLAVLVLALACTGVFGAGKVFLNIATGGTAGTYFPLGGALAEIINAKVAGLNATAVTSGASVANINMLAKDEVQMAFVQNDIAFYAFNGVEMFKDKPYTGLRAVATLYNETIQIVTLASSGIKRSTPARSWKPRVSPTRTSLPSTSPLPRVPTACATETRTWHS
jgi:TRAP transporter TAXI family solute receptor